MRGLLRTLTVEAQRSGIPILRELMEWEVYESLEPFETTRADYRAAHLVQTVLNAVRDTKKKPVPFTLKECRLLFGDDADVASPTRRQSWQEQKSILTAWALTGGTPKKKKSKPTKKPQLP